jgi:hypothetical protein
MNFDRLHTHHVRERRAHKIFIIGSHCGVPQTSLPFLVRFLVWFYNIEFLNC